MKADSILREVWRIKDDLAQEAGGNVHAMCENARRWMAEHPHTGPVAHTPDELRQMVSAAPHAPLAAREQAPPYGHAPTTPDQEQP